MTSSTWSLPHALPPKGPRHPLEACRARPCDVAEVSQHGPLPDWGNHQLPVLTGYPGLFILYSRSHDSVSLTPDELNRIFEHIVGTPTDRMVFSPRCILP
jgi:hypothetical protein